MSEQPSNPPDSPDPAPHSAPESSAPPEAQQRKGLGPLAWVAIILGGLLVLSAGACVACGVMFMNTAREFADNPARAAAELAVRADPDLEVVDSDPDAGTLTIRNTQTGEEATFDFDEIAQGRFSWSTGEGEGGVDVSGEGEEGQMTVRSGEGTTTFGAGATDDLPAWLPGYPGGEVESAGVAMRQEERAAGSFRVLTDDGVDEATGIWRDLLEEAGLQVSVQSFDGTGTAPRALLIGQSEDPRRQVSVTLGRADGRTQMVVQYDGAAGG